MTPDQFWAVAGVAFLLIIAFVVLRDAFPGTAALPPSGLSGFYPVSA